MRWNDLECFRCKKVFASIKRRNEHQTLSCKGEECDICKKRFSSHKSLVEHKNSKHSVNFRCSQCLKCFGGLAKLKRHLPVHDKSKKAAKSLRAKRQFDATYEDSFLMTFMCVEM